MPFYDPREPLLPKKPRKKDEENIHIQVADYLRLQYPDVIFRTDFAAGIKMTMPQAAKHKRLQGGKRSYPDLFIAEPRCRVVNHYGIREGYEYAGLYLELKKSREGVYLKNGDLSKDAHIQEQWAMLMRLQEKGYEANFACGFDDAKRQIEAYMNRK